MKTNRLWPDAQVRAFPPQPGDRFDDRGLDAMVWVLVSLPWLFLVWLLCRY